MQEASYVTLDELAAHVGVKISTVRQWVKRGYIPRNTYIKAGSTYRFCLKDVEASLRDEGTEEDVSTEDTTPVSELSEMVREINEDL
jgi:excisionase family DNA binding protein|tara:strand:+ start:1692 stop:1952 length:261 start_codon:yes stop_codon:yes gene_type:complete